MTTFEVPRITEMPREAFNERMRGKLVRRAEIPERLHKTLADLSIAPDVRVACDALVERVATGGKPIGRGVLLYGPPGRGKTTIAVATLLDALKTAPYDRLGKTPDSYPMRPGYYLTYAGLVETHKASWSKDAEKAEEAEGLLDSLYGRRYVDHWNTRLLVLDDVGKEHNGGSNFTVNVLHDLLRTRYDKAFPTIITTNLAPPEWGSVYGDAMGSFIREAFDRVNVGGKDRR